MAAMARGAFPKKCLVTRNSNEKMDKIRMAKLVMSTGDYVVFNPESRVPSLENWSVIGEADLYFSVLITPVTS